MPLKKMKKISLIYKENKESKNTREAILWKEVPQSTLQPASLTVETALVLPLFLFVMVSILFLFRVLQVNQITYGALAVTGSQLSLEAGVRDVTVAEAALYFQKELIKAECPMQYIRGGRLGFSWQESSVEENMIDLRICYACKLPVPVGAIRNIPIAQRICVRTWNGIDRSGEQEAEADSWVYITPNGSVYHRKRGCTHLKLSIEAMGKREAAEKGYELCRVCGKKEAVSGSYYVTREGNSYHTSLSCRGLKRTIYMIKISKAGNRTACQRCGGG